MPELNSGSLESKKQKKRPDFMYNMDTTKRYAEFLTSGEFRRLQQIIAEDFGFNLDVIKNHKGVSLTVGEQHGQWMRPSYGARIGLLNRLKSELSSIINIDHSSSGAFGLVNDEFTMGGSKSEHITVDLGIPGVSDWKIIGKERSTHHGKTYDCIPAPENEMNDICNGLTFLFGDVNSVVKSVLADEQRMFLEGKGREPLNSVTSFRSKMSHKFPDGNRKIINIPDSSKLLYPSIRLLDMKLDDNILPQIITGNLPNQSPNRSEYRRSFNKKLYNEEIGDMDELFNELLFAIKDIDVYARKLLSLQLGNGNNSLEGNSKSSLAKQGIVKITGFKEGGGVIGCDKQKVLPIYYNVNAKELYYEFSCGDTTEKEIIGRDKVLNLAYQTKTTGPTAVAEYMLLFLSGYIIVDDGHDVDFTHMVKAIFNNYIEANDIQGVDCFPLISMTRVIDRSAKENKVPHTDDVLSFGMSSVRKSIADAISRF